MRRPTRAREFFDLYTRDFSSTDFQRLFTHDAYQFFARHIDDAAFRELPVFKRALVRTRLIFLAFTLKLSPARRVLFAIALVMALVGLAELFRGFGRVGLLFVGFPGPQWADGTMWLFAGFLLVNLLVLLEVADRLSLKNDLEVAREIQFAMLPHDTFRAAGVEAAGQTPGSRFITMFLAILDPVSGELAYVNAGQTPPLLLSHGTATPLATGGMALGMFDAATYSAERCVMTTSRYWRFDDLTRRRQTDDGAMTAEPRGVSQRSTKLRRERFPREHRISSPACERARDTGRGRQASRMLVVVDRAFSWGTRRARVQFQRP